MDHTAALCFGIIITVFQVLFYLWYLFVRDRRSRTEHDTSVNSQRKSTDRLTAGFLILSIMFFLIFLYIGSGCVKNFVPGLFAFALIGVVFVLIIPVVLHSFRLVFGLERRYFRDYLAHDLLPRIRNFQSGHTIWYSIIVFYMTVLADIIVYSLPSHVPYNLLFAGVLTVSLVFSVIFLAVGRNVLNPGRRTEENASELYDNGVILPDQDHPMHTDSAGIGHSGDIPDSGSGSDAYQNSGYDRDSAHHETLCTNPYENLTESYSGIQNLTDDLKESYSVFDSAHDAPTASVYDRYLKLSDKYGRELKSLSRGNSHFRRRKEIQIRKKIEMVEKAWRLIAEARNLM